MKAYYFAPMMRVYSYYVHASNEQLFSSAARNNLAKTLRYCRELYGTSEACRFRDALIQLGSYPVSKYSKSR